MALDPQLIATGLALAGFVIKAVFDERRHTAANLERDRLQSEIRRVEDEIRRVDTLARSRMEEELRREEQRTRTLVVDAETRIDNRIKDLAQPVNAAAGKLAMIDERTVNLTERFRLMENTLGKLGDKTDELVRWTRKDGA